MPRRVSIFASPQRSRIGNAAHVLEIMLRPPLQRQIFQNVIARLKSPGTRILPKLKPCITELPDRRKFPPAAFVPIGHRSHGLKFDVMREVAGILPVAATVP